MNNCYKYILLFIILGIFSSTAWAATLPDASGAKLYLDANGNQSVPLPVSGNQQNIQSVTSYMLNSFNICTEMACDVSNPCCNACTFNSWIDKASGLPVQSLGEALPLCIPDGCGKCPFYLIGQGYTDNINNPTLIYLKSWNKIDHFRPPKSNYPDPAFKLQDEDSADQNDTNDEDDSDDNSADENPNNEEQTQALQEWMQKLKDENNTRLEQLKKEDPKQYQQYQQVIDMFKNAGQQNNPAKSPNPILGQ